MSYLCYLCLFVHSGVQHILCSLSVFLVFYLCRKCCQFPWIVHFVFLWHEYVLCNNSFQHTNMFHRQCILVSHLMRPLLAIKKLKNVTQFRTWKCYQNKTSHAVTYEWSFIILIYCSVNNISFPYANFLSFSYFRIQHLIK